MTEKVTHILWQVLSWCIKINFEFYKWFKIVWNKYLQSIPSTFFFWLNHCNHEKKNWWRKKNKYENDKQKQKKKRRKRIDTPHYFCCCWHNTLTTSILFNGCLYPTLPHCIIRQSEAAFIFFPQSRSRRVKTRYTPCSKRFTIHISWCTTHK